MRTQGRKRYLRMVMWLVPLAVLLSVVTIVWASHTVLTVRADMVTADRIEGRVSIGNTTPLHQTGKLTLAIFELRRPDPKKPGEAPRLDLQKIIMDFGEVVLLPEETKDVPFIVDVRKVGLKGMVLLAADFTSSVDGRAVPHTHGGTVTVTIPEEVKLEPPEVEPVEPPEMPMDIAK